jgi:magnesium-transporting ATPase (P-type)
MSTWLDFDHRNLATAPAGSAGTSPGSDPRRQNPACRHSTPSPVPLHPNPPVHARSAEAVVADLGSTPRGLTSAEAAERLRRHGPNAIPTGTRRHPLLRFLAQFHNALIYFLLAGAAAAAALGHWSIPG